MNEKKMQIYSRHYFFKNSEQEEAVYCSVCRKKVRETDKRVLSIREHAKRCKFGKSDFVEIFHKKTYGYGMMPLNEKNLLFAVFETGFPEKEWNCIYQAVFSRNSRKIKERFLAGNKIGIKEWIRKIMEGEMKCFSTDTMDSAIHFVFPIVPQIYNIEMFYEIYREKGYWIEENSPSFNRLDQMEGKLILYSSDIYRVLRYENLDLESMISIEYALKGERRFKSNIKYQKFTLVVGDTFRESGKIYLAMKVYQNDILSGVWKITKMILSDQSLNMNGEVDLYRIASGRVFSFISPSALKEFSGEYPSFGLKKYIKNGGKNILLPLLVSGNYHKGMELLIKTGLSGLADAYFAYGENGLRGLFYKEPSVEQYSTVSELLGMPLSLIRRIPEEYLMKKADRDRWMEILHYNRSFLDGIEINNNTADFLFENNITHGKDWTGVNDLPGISDLSDSQIRLILKYLTQNNYDLYKNYIYMMFKCQLFEDGWRPRNLKKAYERLCEYAMSEEEKFEYLLFIESVRSYSAYETEKNESFFSGDPYFIRCPENFHDLYDEATQQHNCVFDYKDAIIEGNSEIYYLREKENPEKSLVTIEVRQDKLIQAKAKYNKKASRKCQKFIVKWCRFYHISIDTSDISSQIIAA